MELSGTKVARKFKTSPVYHLSQFDTKEKLVSTVNVTNSI